MKNIVSLLLGLVLLNASCKPREIKAPEPDLDTESATEAMWALLAVTDIEQMAAFTGEDQLIDHFYKADPGVASTGTVTATRNPDANMLNVSFNQSQCADGKFRSGTVFTEYGYSESSNTKPYYTLYNVPNTNPRFYHEFGFLGRLSLVDYNVNGWTIKVDSSVSSYAVVYNYMKKSDYDPRLEPLKMRFVGSFVLFHPTDASKNMTLKCDLIKTVVNSTSPQVFAATTTNKTPPVKWLLANVSYAGKVEGTSAVGRPYRLQIDENHPLTRDFTCFPDKVSNIALASGTGTQSISSFIEEFHPFNAGVVSFTTSIDSKEQYPRMIFMGNEGNLDLPSQCDNSGEILIKGISYKIDFRK